MNLDSFNLDGSTARLWRILWVLAATGSVSFAIFRGFGAGASFAAGSLLSALNLALLVKMVKSMGGSGSSSPSAFKNIFLGLRYVLLGLLLYVMIKKLDLHLAAVLSGLLIAVGAVILEILYELIHGT